MYLKKKKGLFLVNEPDCLNTESGAFRHITAGFNELSSYYEMTFFLRSEKKDFYNLNLAQNKRKDNKKKIILGNSIAPSWKGSLLDLKEFITNLIDIFPLIYKISKVNPDFIYERASYLNFSGLITAKILGIPHFYEANGLQFERRFKYYKSIFTKLNRLFEKSAYSYSNYVFFVGTYGHYWKLNKNNWSNIENGIEESYLDKFDGFEKKSLEGKVNVCFIARLMKHQRTDILIDAFKYIKNKGRIRLYLVGSGLEVIEHELKPYIEVVNLGFKDRDTLKEILSEMHLGLIAGSPEYQSTMKIFDYGSAKCAVLAPDIYNLKYWFKENIIFFENSNSKDLARSIDRVVMNPAFIFEYGNKLFYKIKADFTWKDIYGKVNSIIIKSI